jgi:hypothetical protein
VLSAVVDFTVQETQKTLARALEEENRIAIAQCKAYAGNKPRSFYVSMGKVKGKVDYTPNKHFTTDDNVVSYSQAGAHFTTDDNVVSYSQAGADINNLVIAGGQRVAMGTMSKEAFMRIDPLVEDVEKERDAVVAEQLEQSLLSGLQQQAAQGALPPSDLAQGALPPSDLARIMQLVRNDQHDLAEAVEKVQREAQERQAEQVQPGAPEAQPGIAMPGAGAEAGGGAPAEAPPPDLRALLGAL